jgi:hypothetical protein
VTLVAPPQRTPLTASLRLKKTLARAAARPSRRAVFRCADKIHSAGKTPSLRGKNYPCEIIRKNNYSPAAQLTHATSRPAAWCLDLFSLGPSPPLYRGTIYRRRVVAGRVGQSGRCDGSRRPVAPPRRIHRRLPRRSRPALIAPACHSHGLGCAGSGRADV